MNVITSPDNSRDFCLPRPLSPPKAENLDRNSFSYTPLLHKCS